MTLTTQTGITATETIHQDIRPGANRVLPNGQILSEDAQILMDKSIVAKPLGTPTAEQIKIKDTSFRYRWVNRSGGGGILFMWAKQKGFTLATPEHAEPLSCEITNDNGEIRMHDVVLMKIPVEKYQSGMKYSMQQALLRARDKRYLTGSQGEAPSTDVFSDDKAVVHSAKEIDKSDGAGKYVKTFEPTEAELDAKMGPDTADKKPGRK